MFCHVKELQFDVHVEEPDPRFASLLLEQFGGGNGELKAAMQYFVQAFSCRKPYPEKYDLLMDIATEELSHLEIVGATITMLLDGINGELKDAANNVEWVDIMNDNAKKEQFIHEAVMDPQFLSLSGGGPKLSDSQGNPWTANYVTANGDPTVDLRSNIAAESRAKIVYEYLMQFTDDPGVKDTLGFLMTREIAHFKQFQAALEDIQPNFPPGVLQGDPRFTHKYFNMSNGEDVRGPWNQGQGPWQNGEQWEYIEDPVNQVVSSQGQKSAKAGGDKKSSKEAKKKSQELSKQRSQEIKQSMSKKGKNWSDYSASRASQPGSPSGDRDKPRQRPS
ncbi:manganese catalase family protein [Persicimonas caeni]|uniref:Manganese catalase family protein n=1 Tax=Persicimonas caeni TaxID=2292766 RepID=A0A4Y6Q164_PERCE|nr:manganese catalase family protein [Persicimonas caeni]QDG54179.1 manganese catalase family protein [Persicimonas caeni]QED35400.1 manganese catalase family protein [Persicimonas caeni]